MLPRKRQRQAEGSISDTESPCDRATNVSCDPEIVKQREAGNMKILPATSADVIQAAKHEVACLKRYDKENRKIGVSVSYLLDSLDVVTFEPLTTDLKELLDDSDELRSDYPMQPTYQLIDTTGYILDVIPDEHFPSKWRDLTTVSETDLQKWKRLETVLLYATHLELDRVTACYSVSNRSVPTDETVTDRRETVNRRKIMVGFLSRLTGGRGRDCVETLLDMILDIIDDGATAQVMTCGTPDGTSNYQVATGSSPHSDTDSLTSTTTALTTTDNGDNTQSFSSSHSDLHVVQFDYLNLKLHTILCVCIKSGNILNGEEDLMKDMLQAVVNDNEVYGLLINPIMARIYKMTKSQSGDLEMGNITVRHKTYTFTKPDLHSPNNIKQFDSDIFIKFIQDLLLVMHYQITRPH